jgi:hypothetical protein
VVAEPFVGFVPTMLYFHVFPPEEKLDDQCFRFEVARAISEKFP